MLKKLTPHQFYNVKKYQGKALAIGPRATSSSTPPTREYYDTNDPKDLLWRAKEMIITANTAGDTYRSVFMHDSQGECVWEYFLDGVCCPFLD